MKSPIKGQHFVQILHYFISSTLRFALWLWRRCFPLGFTKAIVLPTSFPCCSGVGAARVTSPEPSSAFSPLSWMVLSFVGFALFLLVISVNVCTYGLTACFCHKVTFTQPGGFDHSVFDTFAPLTEGRSARDQPKQPPAKKKEYFPESAMAAAAASSTLRVSWRSSFSLGYHQG